MPIWKPILFLIVLTGVGLWPALSSANGDGGPQPHPIELNQLTQEMLANNQELTALAQKVAALKEDVQAAGALDDPRFGLNLLNLPADSFQFDEAPMTQKQITLAQRIPWFGKRDLKTQRAVLKALRLESILNARRLQLIHELADAYYALGFVGASQEINDRMTHHIDQIAISAETRYAAGKGLQQDILQAHVEQSGLMDKRNKLDREHRSLEDKINGLLNRDSYVPITVQALADLPDLGAAIAKWQALVLDANPDLQTRRIEIEQAKVDIDLSRKAYYPDPDLKLAYGQRDADANGNERSDFISAGITISLPVWAKRKQDRSLEAAAKRRDAAKSMYQNLAAQLPHRVNSLAAELHQIRQNHTLYKEAILVQADQWAESARFSYEVGKVNFNTMVSAQLQALKLERLAKQYLYQFYQKMATLDNLLGGRLHAPEIQSTAPSTQKAAPKRASIEKR